MMPRDLAFWYALAPWHRTFLACTVMMLVFALCWWGVVYPQEAARVSLEAQREVQQVNTPLRWKTLLALRPVVTIDEREKENSDAFSPLAFQSAGRELLRWQPTAEGGELVLESPWEEVPRTFLQLAKGGILASAFSLAKKEGVMHFTLQLERGNGR